MIISRITSLSLTAALSTVVVSIAVAGPAEIATKPPMGWNSFDSYGVYLNEKAAKENPEAEAKVFDVWKGRKEHKLTAAAPIEIDVNPDGVLFLRNE